jgi:hypothetical protein
MKNRNIIAILSALVGLALLPMAQAAPAPEFPDPGSTCAFCTADGLNALANATGAANSAFGWFSLFSNTDGSFNTAVGAGTLLFNNGGENTAVGTAALLFNTTGGNNNAIGSAALLNNIDGFFNNAHGRQALTANTGSENNAFGDFAMQSNTTGSSNTAVGDDALRFSTTGSFNVVIGDEAGTNLVTGDQNIYIGAGVGGVDGDLRFIRIGDTSFLDYDCFIAGIFGRAIDAGTAVLVGVDADQKLGTVAVDANGNRVPFKPQAMVDESLKQQKRIAELEGTVERLASMLKEQAAQIQKVSAQLEMTKPATKVVAGNQ